MESVLNPSLKEIVLSSINQKLILQGVGWDFYERVLDEFSDSNALHFAYNDGFLEVEVPLLKHEVPSRVLSDFITIICGELGIDARNVGSTTFRKQAKAKGCEADTVFYIQNEQMIRGRSEIDLNEDPPPDLVIEVDVTSPSLDKLPIYAALGVPEVWLYKGKKVDFYKLVGEEYEETSNSLVLPMLDSEITTEFLQKGLAESPSKWFREVKDWIANNSI
jgi:Uma2 family endonuclease